MTGKSKDITGQRYGRLTAAEQLGKNGRGTYQWRCQCDCGSEKTVSLELLTCGDTKSCGCLQIDRASTLNKTHGLKGTSEHNSWQRMRQRMLNPSCKDYPNYGGAGLIMEASWDNFETFLAYMGLKPKDGKRYSIERLDLDVGYVKGNVVWAVDTQQARNKGAYSNNKTGETGVQLRRHPSTGIWSYISTWRQDNVKRTKTFAISKHGLLPAFSKAVTHRRLMIQKIKCGWRWLLY